MLRLLDVDLKGLVLECIGCLVTEVVVEDHQYLTRGELELFAETLRKWPPNSYHT